MSVEYMRAHKQRWYVTFPMAFVGFLLSYVVGPTAATKTPTRTSRDILAMVTGGGLGAVFAVFLYFYVPARFEAASMPWDTLPFLCIMGIVAGNGISRATRMIAEEAMASSQPAKPAQDDSAVR